MNNKKILIIGSKEKFSIEKMYERAFVGLKHKSKFLHIYQIRKSLIHNLIWKFLRYFYFLYIRIKIINYLDNNDNFDLIIIFKGIYLKKNFINKIKKKYQKSKIINIFTDDPFETNYFEDISNNNVLVSITEFDHIFTYSNEINNKLKKNYKKDFFTYLPFAFDHSLIRTKKIKYKPMYDLSFIGTADDYRYNILKKLNNYKIILAGDGWNKYSLGQNIRYLGNVNFSKYYKIVNESKFSLNLLRKQNKSSNNMKTFEIPSMGGLMITERNKDQDSFFPENHACLMFDSIKDLKLKLNSYDKNLKTYKKIKSRGVSIGKQNTYFERAKSLLNEIYK